MQTTKKINARIKLKGETSENWKKSNVFVPIKNEMILVHDKGNAIVITEDGNNQSVAELIKDPPYFFPVLKGKGEYSVIEGRETAWDYKKTKLCTITQGIGPDDRDYWGREVIVTLTIPDFHRLNTNTQTALLEKANYYEYPLYVTYHSDGDWYSAPFGTALARILNRSLSNDNTVLTILSSNTYPLLPNDSHTTANPSPYKDIIFYTENMVATSKGVAADAPFSHSEGNGNILDSNSIAAHAEGENNKAAGAPYAHLEGRNNRIQGSQADTATFNSVHIEGANNVVSGHKIAGAHVEGMQNKAHNERAHAEGFQTIANGDQSHTEGLRTTTKHSAAHAEGVDTIAWGRGSHVEGNTTVALTAHSHAEGEHTLAGAKGYYWEAIEFTKNEKDQITGGTIYLCATQLKKGQFPIIGTGKRYDNLVPGYAIGDKIAIINKEHFYTNAKITAIDHNIITYEGDIGFTEIKTLAEEDDIRDLDEYSMWVVTTPDPLKTEGTVYASALNTNAHAEGLATQALGEGAHSEGGACIAYGDYSHAEGKYTKASYSAHAEGDSTNAIGQRSHAEGTRTTALGNSSHAEGTDTKANDYNAHAEGKNSTASGEASHAEGIETLAQGNGAHAEGAKLTITYTKDDDTKEVVEQSSQAIGNAAHAEGYGTIANGEGAHAEGYGMHYLSYNERLYKGYVNGKAAHGEGVATIALGEGAHAEGRYTYAEGYSVHAEGYLTTAKANHAHVEGRETEASGAAAHAGGRGTKATAEAQTAIGKYNRVNNDALFIVGNGTGSADNQRLNAFEVLKNGNANIAGTLNVTALTIGGVNILPITNVEFPGGDA